MSMEPLKGKNVLEVIRQGTALLEELKVFYWCSAGTALGLVRGEQGFIDWDTDIDVEVWVKQDEPTIIRSLFEEQGFKPFVVYKKLEGNEERMYQQAYKGLENIVFDIFYYYDDEENFLINKNAFGTLKMPKKFLKPLSLERGFLVPNPVKEYLIYSYGEDWETPTNKKVSWENDVGEALVRK